MNSKQSSDHKPGFPEIHKNALDGLTLEQEAKQLRREIVETLHETKGGHYGGCLSVVDILLVLYRRQLHICPSIPRHSERDRLILSKGHAAVALYAILRRLAYFDSPLSNYANFSSLLEGHPDMTRTPGVDFSSGSLGQGLSVGIGMALALRNRSQRVWVVLGDGECQEGQVWEAAMLAATCCLDNIVAVIDCNCFQEWGWNSTKDNPYPEPVPEMARKWQAFGWNVIECDGHNHAAIESAISAAIETCLQPSVILAHTKKGKGIPLIESAPWRFHCEKVSQDEHTEIMKSLE